MNPHKKKWKPGVLNKAHGKRVCVKGGGRGSKGVIGRQTRDPSSEGDGV